MSIRVDIAHTDAVLLIPDHGADPAFSGYMLQRRTNAADWQDWTGTGWGGAASPLSANRLTDYSLPPGLFQYRARVRYEAEPGVFSYSAWEESAWFRIASSTTDRVGWTLGNYAPPPGAFGEVLTADDMRQTYLWGVPFTSSGGVQYTDPQIRAMIDATVAEFEKVLNLTIKRRVIKCADDLTPESVFDDTEDAYYYHRMNWNAGGRINLKRRPVLSVERFDLYTITQGKIMDLVPWLKIDHRKGVLHFYPRMDKSGVMKVYPAFLTQGYLRAFSYDHGYRIDYTAGFEDASKVPDDLRDIIGKAAACRLLNIIGDGLIAGFASMSLGMDGLSESFSTTASATNAMYGARINQYLKEIETYLKQNKNKFGSFVMGSI